MHGSSMAQYFLGAAAIGYGILLIWFLLFVNAKNWMRDIHIRWFDIDPKSFDMIHYCGMGLYKLFLIVLFFIPLLVTTLWNSPK